jgi:hypothetical protein
MTTIGGNTEGPATGQPSETSEPVRNKTTTTIGGKTEGPGHVKGKKKSGEATGERPFLYLVKEDEAFIVGSNLDSMAAIAYRAYCTSPNSHR